jgi:hypothetical protein
VIAKFTRLHDATTQKPAIIVLPAVRTSNPTKYINIYFQKDPFCLQFYRVLCNKINTSDCMSFSEETKREKRRLRLHWVGKKQEYRTQSEAFDIENNV